MSLASCNRPEPTDNKPQNVTAQQVPAATEAYELQERCGKQAEEIFKKEPRSTDEDYRTLVHSYTNHYNKKLNKCFILFKDTGFYKKETHISSTISDVNENKDYGTYFKTVKNKKPFLCNVNGKYCNSEGEWEALLKPFMEE